jgi:catechol 2,3-dioxygenase-like lactoylglutathione lyase family enzyme
LPDTPRSLRRGQSFVGLLMVLLVLTLLTAFAAPRVDLTRFRSDAIARQAAGVFSGASRAARQRRHDVFVRVDSAGKRLGVVSDPNGNGRRDPGESEVWTDLDPSADILDPPTPLPTLPESSVRRPLHTSGVALPVSVGGVAFRRGGGAGADFVLYLTSDPGLPSAWRAVHVTSRTGSVHLWRFDGTRWTRGRT